MRPELKPDQVAIIDSRKMPPGMLMLLNIEFHSRGWYTLDNGENKRFWPKDQNTASILYWLWSKRSRSRKYTFPPLHVTHSRSRAKRKRAFKTIHCPPSGHAKRIRGMTT